MKTIDQTIATLEDKLNRAKTKKRADQTRQKIIAGALVLSAIDNDREKKDWVLGLLRKVTRDADKRVTSEMIEELEAGQGG